MSTDFVRMQTKIERRAAAKELEAVYCPMCGAYNHPYKKENEKGLFCKSCNKDMMGYIDAMKQFIEDVTKLNKGEDVEPIT